MGARVEVFLLEAEDEERERLALFGETRQSACWWAIRILLPQGLRAEILSHGEFGERTVRFHSADVERPVSRILYEIGEMPLPPYIERHARRNG